MTGHIFKFHSSTQVFCLCSIHNTTYVFNSVQKLLNISCMARVIGTISAIWQKRRTDGNQYEGA